MNLLNFLINTLINFLDQLIINSFRATRKECGDIENLLLNLKNSEDSVKNTALNKLDVIGEQIRFLQKQAMEILKDANDNAQLHKIPCNFVKVPGNIYHLYERESGEKLWSMVSPSEFGSNKNLKHLGSYRLEGDKSFTPIDKIQDYQSNRQFAEALLESSEFKLLALEGISKKKIDEEVE